MAKIITNASELGKAIDVWAKRGTKWTQDGQMLGLSALTRLAEFGDIGYVNRLYLAMPKGTKSSAMASWFLTYGSLRANEDKNSKADKPFLFDKEKETSVAGAEADPWFMHKPEPDADQVFDLQKALMAVLKKAGNAAHVAHGDLIGKIEAILAEGTPESEKEVEDEVEESLSA